jgi:hypothetical protein
MHENRETSGVPRPARERGRSAKASSQKADAHALEESDRAIRSMNQTNKEERSSAEHGEKRARAKENIVQPNTNPTQSGERVSQGLSGVREAAKKRRQERFTALLHHVSVDLLRDSYYALKRQAAPGVDGVTWQEYETGLEGRLADLHNRVHRGAYRTLAANVAAHSSPPQSTTTHVVGPGNPDLQAVDSSSTGIATLSYRSLPRHSSKVGAVCVEAPVRFCAGGDQ